MANLTQTSSQVGVGGSDTLVSDAPMQAGESITEGQPVYLKASDNKWYRTNAVTSAETAGSGPRRVRIALTPAATNEYFMAAIQGPVKVGATTTVGTVMYGVSATTGAICPIGDLVSTNRVMLLGVSTVSGIIDLNPRYTGILL